MIIYGSRMYFKRNRVISFGECEHCGRYGKQVSYKARKFGHIYFIPLIPLGPPSQVLRECKHCSMGIHLNDADLEPIVDQLANEFKNWAGLIADGQKEIASGDDGESLNIGAMIAASLPNLYCLREMQSPDALTDLLDASGMRMEKELVLGKWNEIQGDLDAARQNYEAAHRIEPESLYPLYALGHVELLRKDQASAEVAFSRYLQLEPNDISVMAAMADSWQRAKNFPKVVEWYDKIYEINPELVENPGMKKIYRKACKKSGSQGKFLDQME